MTDHNPDSANPLYKINFKIMQVMLKLKIGNCKTFVVDNFLIEMRDMIKL
jgi:hypothetical protein